jgi:hypothetical protein
LCLPPHGLPLSLLSSHSPSLIFCLPFLFLFLTYSFIPPST